MAAPWAPPRAATRALHAWLQDNPVVWRSWWPTWAAGRDEEEQARRLQRLAGCPGSLTHLTDPSWADRRSFKGGGKAELYESPTERFIAAVDREVATVRASRRAALHQTLRRLDDGEGIYEGVALGC